MFNNKKIKKINERIAMLEEWMLHVSDDTKMEHGIVDPFYAPFEREKVKDNLKELNNRFAEHLSIFNSFVGKLGYKLEINRDTYVFTKK